MIPVGMFFIDVLYEIRKFLFILSLLRIFIVNGFQILSNAFSSLIEMIYVVFLFHFVNAVND